MSVNYLRQNRNVMAFEGNIFTFKVKKTRQILQVIGPPFYGSISRSLLQHRDGPLAESGNVDCIVTRYFRKLPGHPPAFRKSGNSDRHDMYIVFEGWLHTLPDGSEGRSRKLSRQ
jgi:hypothetical protein